MPAEEARPEDHVRPPLADERDQLRVLLRRVLEVGVLDDHQVARHRREPGPQRGALALVPLVEQQPEPVPGLERRQHVARAVGRAVVHDDQFDADAARRARAPMISSIVSRSLKTGITTESSGSVEHALQPRHQSLLPSPKPCGCAARHRHADLHDRVEVGEPRPPAQFLPDPRARREQHRRDRPAGAAPHVQGTRRPLTRSTASMTWRTENGVPLPRL